MTTEKEYDVFISYASEDKEGFVRPLAMILSKLGVKVWFDEFAFRVGDSLSRSIDKGLANSKYGIVVLSRAFISKGWPEYELRGLTSREIGEGKVILPIWHNISRDQVLAFSPPLADKFALNTNKLNLGEIALRILETVKPEILKSFLRLALLRKIISQAESASIPVSEVKIAPIRHKSLPDSLLIRIKIVHNTLRDLLPNSLEETINNFRRDVNPYEEIVVWEQITAAYLDVTQGKSLPIEKRRAIFSMLLAISMGDIDKVQRVAKAHFDHQEMRELSKIFKSTLPEIPK